MGRIEIWLIWSPHSSFTVDDDYSSIKFFFIILQHLPKKKVQPKKNSDAQFPFGSKDLSNASFPVLTTSVKKPQNWAFELVIQKVLNKNFKNTQEYKQVTFTKTSIVITFLWYQKYFCTVDKFNKIKYFTFCPSSSIYTLYILLHI